MSPDTPSPALPERTRERQRYVAWLIECHTTEGARWLVSTIGEAQWTDDALTACQFETERDAQREINRRGGTLAFSPSGCLAFPTDHQFILVRPDDTPAALHTELERTQTENESLAAAFRVAAKKVATLDAMRAELERTRAALVKLANRQRCVCGHSIGVHDGKGCVGNDCSCATPATELLSALGSPDATTRRTE